MHFALLKKDFGVYRQTIVGSTVLTLVPYVSAVLLQYFYPSGNSGQTSAGYRAVLHTASTLGAMVMVAVAAAFGAVAFAAERRERSAEFVAMLPIRRRTIVASKLVVALGCLVVMFAWHFTVLHFSAPRLNVSDAVTILGGVALMAFGMAWLFSTFLRSTGLAGGISLAVTVGAMFLIRFIGEGMISSALRHAGGRDWQRIHDDAHHVLDLATVVFPFSVGVLFLLVGTLYYLRRVTP